MTRSRFNYLFKNLWKNCKDLLLSKMKHQFSQFISAYRKSFSLEHVLIRFLEDWRNKLDNNDVVSAVLTDLPKAFDWIPHDSLVAKLNACSFNRDTVAYIYSYLKKQKAIFQNKYYSKLPQRYCLSCSPGANTRPHFIYNLFFSDFFYFILLATAHNFTDEKTLLLALEELFKN